MLFTTCFILACVLLLGRLLFRFAPYRRGRKARMVLFPALFLLGLVAVFAYQTTWQLAGFMRPDFVRFMERYNRRPDNAANHLIRGALLDRDGHPLAYTEENGQGGRLYPFGPAMAHIVGFRHPTEGLTGMECAADDRLTGARATFDRKALREAGHLVLQAERHIGTNVTLTIRPDLQLRAWEEFQERFPDGCGAAVALDPKTGDVLLVYSHPSFDPGAYERTLAIDPRAPLLNRALHGRYPPGSTFKTAIAGLLADCQREQTLFCPPEGWTPPGARRPIRDHEYYLFEKRGLSWPGYAPPDNLLDLDTALAKSSNTYFSQAGVACGTDAFNAFVERARLRERLPLYTNGTERVSCRGANIPWLGRGDKQELAQLSIGQGRLLVTPFHMALLTAAFANGGVAMRPRLTPDDPVAPHATLFSASVAARIRRAMREVVRRGTGRAADLPSVSVCGKTGTAQNPGGEDHAWFVCFAPEEDPRIAIAVLVENGGSGSAAALPIARALLQTFFALP